MSNSRTCPFCSRPADSVEHVIPKWMTRRFLANASPRAYFTLLHDGAEQRRSRTMNQKVKVCAECNNGWMSQVEQNARPLLEGLADDVLKNLRVADQEHLARWLFKTSVMLELLMPTSGRISTYDQRIALKSGEIPWNWSAHIARAERVKGEAVTQNPGPIANVNSDDGTLLGRARLTTTRFGFMAAQVLIHNLDETPPFQDLLGGDNFSSQIWPTRGSVKWPPGNSLTPDLFDIVCRMRTAEG